jgi:membrane protein required for colicin V production
MPIIDIIIAVAVAISIVVGIIRGFVKEAISIAALLLAIWAALYFGPAAGGFSDGWFASEDLQKWFGRILVFLVVLAIGGLVGWIISKLVRHSALSGMDRFLGSAFGAGRGILLVAVAIIGGQYAGFDNDQWWSQSRLIPHLEVVADWIKVMAPEGLDLIVPDEEAESLPGEGPIEV